MRSTIGARGLLLLLALAPLAPVHAQSAEPAGAHIQIAAVDLGSHPEIDLTVVVRDAYGRGVTGLNGGNFTVEEGGRTIPGEQIQIAPIDDLLAPVTLAVVADLSKLLGERAIADERSAAQTLVAQLMRSEQSAIEVGVFVPRSNTSAPGQPILALPFTSDRSKVAGVLAKTEPRPGQTDLYNTVVAAINASADLATQRGGPAYVVVLSDGLDRTSIAGTGTAGANEAARVAEERRVHVFTLGFGAALKHGSALLAQLADRAGGTYQPQPTAGTLANLAQQLRAGGAGGAYQLRYSSSLAPDGAEHPLIVRARLGDRSLAAETTVLAPRPWDRATPTQADLLLDAQKYPDLTLWTRPINRLRQTVPQLVAADVRLTVDGEPLDVPLNITSEPLEAHDPAAAQSMALVVDQGSEQAAALRRLATTLLQASTEVPSRVALFVPGVQSEAVQFTHDHNALINSLNKAADQGAEGGSIGATLLRAIDAAARDGDAATRPAYVVVLTGSPIAPADRARALTLARDLGVTIHTISAGKSADEGIVRLAEATEGTHISNPDQAALTALASRIAKNRATRYRISFQSPLLADGKARNLTLAVGDVQVTEPFIPVTAGAAAVRSPLPVAVQVLIFGLVALALAGCALLPRALRDRRLRCPVCQKVRRASWGNTCLFCERATIEGTTDKPSDVPLEGFALQGASLMQESLPVPAQAALPDAVVAFPPDQAEPAALAVADGEQVAAEPIAIASAIPAPTAPALASITADQVRTQSHTDFWGPLPEERPETTNGEQRTKNKEQRTKDHGPRTTDHGPRTTDLEAAPALIAAEQYDRHSAAEQPEQMPVPALQTSVRNVAVERPSEQSDGLTSHTDFWGPLPEQTSAATLESPAIDEPIGDISVPPAEQPSHESRDPMPDSDHQRSLIDKPTPIVSRAAAATHDQHKLAEHEEPKSDTGFWGPIELATTADGHAEN